MRLAAVLTLVLGFGRRHIHCFPTIGQLHRFPGLKAL